MACLKEHVIAQCNVTHHMAEDQLRDHTGQKAKYWLVLKEIIHNTRRPLFFSACVGIVLVNNISSRKNSRREVGGPAQRLQAAVEQLTAGEHPAPALDFFRAISA
jgi:hypothetical protein